MTNKYKKLDIPIQEMITQDKKMGWQNPFRCNDENAIRRDQNRDKPNLWRTPFIRDTEKILHLPTYNRYSDKTQVFSCYKNDDITRRALHVQLVSRIARTIGNVLGLNTDLIEAISLGHDIGHTPFGHTGEKVLSNLLHSETGLFFNHNVNSVRVLDNLFKRNITLQTLDGVLCHNGELELQEYKPKNLEGFDEFDKIMTDCSKSGAKTIKQLVPSTLEACIVRISDIIAYIGKDRQDAIKAKFLKADDEFQDYEIGTWNSEIINNLTVDIINNSYRKNYISLSPNLFEALKNAKSENYKKIYQNQFLSEKYDDIITPMFKDLFYKLLDDVVKQDKNSIIWKHHIDFMNDNTMQYNEHPCYETTSPQIIVTDFIASMTDDYFIDLHELLFPQSKLKLEYKSYFVEIK